MADQKISQFPVSQTFGDADVVTGVQGGANKNFSKQAIRSINGISGSWNMTRVVADAEPDVGFATEAGVTENSPHNWSMIPAGGSSQIKMQGSNGGVPLPSVARSARLRVTSESAANIPLQGFLFANQEATEADIATVVFSGVPTGSCTHLAAVYFDIGGIIPGGAMKVYTRIVADGQDETEVIVATGGIVAGDEAYITLNTDASISVTINAGSPVTTAAQWDTTDLSGIRLVIIGYYGSAATPVGNLNFDFSDNTGGRTGFVAMADPTLPVGATNGKRYLVSHAGGFGGKNTAVGDVVELMNAMTEVIVIQAAPLTPTGVESVIANYLNTNPVIDLLMAARARGVMVTAANDAPAPYFGGFVRGDAVMVGDTPTGTFSGFSYGNIAVWDNDDSWTEFTPDQFRGVKFFPIDPNCQQLSVTYIDTGASVVFDDQGSFVGYPLNTLKTFGWTFDKIVRTSLKSSAPNVSMTNGGTDTITLDTAEQFYLLAAPGGTYTVQFVNSGIAHVFIWLSGAGSATVNVQGLGHQIFLDDTCSTVLMIVKDNQVVCHRVVAQEAWRSLDFSFSGSWSYRGGGYEVAKFRRIGDTVHIRGNVANGTAASIFTLPVGFRPPADLVIPATVQDGANAPVLSLVTLNTSGVLSLVSPSTPLGDHKVGFCFSFSVTP
jgi:hypothetical protein